MTTRLSRLRRTIGAGGIVLLVFALGLFLLAICGGRIFERPWLPLLYAILGIGTAITVTSWAVHALSAKTKPGEDIVPRLIGSRLQYCLLLGRYGAAGETVVKNGWGNRAFLLGWLRRTATLDQVVAYAAARHLGLTTYTVVEQGRVVAPPGPVHLRMPADGWLPAVAGLIRRAYAIVMVLSARPEIQDGMWWEIEQILEHDLITRLIIVLPPADQDRDVYREARYQLCKILAVLHDPLVFNDVDVDLRGNAHPEWLSKWIDYYDGKFLPGGERDRDRSGGFRKSVQLVYFFRGDGAVRIQWHGIDWERRVSLTSAGRRKPIVADTYIHGLAAAFEAVITELAKLPFEERYPWPRSEYQ